jgi:hypothetical protein
LVLAESKDEAEETEGINDDGAVAGSVADNAVPVIVGVIELRLVKKTPLDTAKDVD